MSKGGRDRNGSFQTRDQGTFELTNDIINLKPKFLYLHDSTCDMCAEQPSNPTRTSRASALPLWSAGRSRLAPLMSAFLVFLSLYSCAVILSGCRNGLGGNRRRHDFTVRVLPLDLLSTSQFRAIEFCDASFLLSHADSTLQPRRGNIRLAQLIELQLAEEL